MNFKKIALGIATVGLLTSCSNIIELIGTEGTSVSGFKKDKLNIVFSHNINGETHPCGCRHFPLGGLPQAAGQIEILKKDSDLLYVDTGDTFFVSSKIPESIYDSTIYNAKEVAKALDKIGLDYFVPGDQDFAAGVQFLADISKKSKFTFLMANLRDDEKSNLFKFKRWQMHSKGPHKIFLTGVVFPDTLDFSQQRLFTKPGLVLPQIFDEMKKAGFDENNKFHRLIVLSHGGIDNDEALAKQFPQIEWIIGAHSQSFTKFPIKEGKKTKIVQVLSRNHYLGSVEIALNKDRSADTYSIHEIREERAKGLNPNPWFAFIDKHKEALDKIQIEEQAKLSSFEEGNFKYNTSTSCISCHEPQGNHWQGTAHSIAYMTLVQAKEQNNLSCVKCHALGTSDPKGFAKVSDIIMTESEVDGTATPEETKKLKAMKKKYWQALQSDFVGVGSIRELSQKKTRKLAKKWQALDDKHGISHNFANVQCLNCHDQHQDHPFTTGLQKPTKDMRFESIKKKCLACHDPDQSPAWYNGKKLNRDKFNKYYDDIACPKREE